MDLIIRQFRNDLIKHINSIDIPIEIKRLIVMEIYNQIASETELVIQSQINQENQNKGEGKE